CMSVTLYLYPPHSHPFSPHRFSFNTTPTPEIYTLSLHDALPIFTVNAKINSEGLNPSASLAAGVLLQGTRDMVVNNEGHIKFTLDRKSTRLNSSHVKISYAVFCLKKKKKPKNNPP